jgi:hypothetical protein
MICSCSVLSAKAPQQQAESAHGNYLDDMIAKQNKRSISMDTITTYPCGWAISTTLKNAVEVKNCKDDLL